MPRIEVAGDICLRRKTPAQGCRADDDDDEEEEEDDGVDTYVGSWKKYYKFDVNFKI